MVACRRFCCLVALASLAILGGHTAAAPPSTAPVEGLRQNTPAVHALTNVRIVPEPGRVIDKGTIVVRDGVIEAVGADVKPPADARVWDLAGKTVYAGLIDAYSEHNITANPRTQGSPHWNPQVTPQFEVADHYSVAESLNEKLRGQGITVRLVAPGTRIIKGQSAVVTTGSTDTTRAILKRGVAQHFRLTVARGGNRDDYPNSPMGAVALARQTMLDADWYTKAWAAWRGNSELTRPERNDALEALAACLAKEQPAIVDAANEQYALRADRFAREFGLQAILRGSGREYRRLDEIKATGRPVIVPVNFPQPPAVGTLEEAHDLTLEQLMHWDHAPENPSRLVGAGVMIALTSHGLRDQATFLASVRRAVERGLTPDAALRALTTTPASLLGIAERHGKIAPGMAANLVVTDGDLFAKKTKVIATWVDGERFEIEKTPEFDPRGTWEVEIAGDDGRVLKLQIKIAGTAAKPSGTIARPAVGENKADEVKLAEVAANEGQLRFRFEAKSFGKEGPARATATISLADEAKPTLLGTVVWGDGSSERLTGSRVTGPKATDKTQDEAEDKENEQEDTDEHRSRARMLRTRKRRTARRARMRTRSRSRGRAIR
jgi:imidazolonepropionase-like amidohydrolase